MDIGTESPAIVIEPIEVPVPGHQPAPAPVGPAPVAPVEAPDKELVPA